MKRWMTKAVGEGREMMNIRTRSKVRGTIPAKEVEAVYRKTFNVSIPGFWKRVIMAISGHSWQSSFFLADAYYKKTDEELIKLILEEDETNLQRYKSEFYDCDDFTFRLMGMFHQNLEAAAMPIFITWVYTPRGGHAVLSYYADKKVKIIEPQNDAIFPVPKNWKLMLLCG